MSKLLMAMGYIEYFDTCECVGVSIYEVETLWGYPYK